MQAETSTACATRRGPVVVNCRPSLARRTVRQIMMDCIQLQTWNSDPAERGAVKPGYLAITKAVRIKYGRFLKVLGSRDAQHSQA